VASFATTGVEKLWPLTRGRPDVVVALIDGPVALHLDAFAHSRVRTLDENAQCQSASSLACLHGTFIAAMLVGDSVDKPPPLCSGSTLLVRPIFSEQRGVVPATTATELAAAVRDCVAAGASVINLSVALVGGPQDTRVLTAALSEAADADTLIVVAAGNAGDIGGSDLTRHPAVIPVAACSRDGNLMPDSNLARSGGRRGLLAPGDGVSSIDGAGYAKQLDGTSVAAPFVSAAAVLLRSLFPRASAADIRQALVGVVPRPRSLIPPALDAWLAYQQLAHSKGPAMTDHPPSDRSVSANRGTGASPASSDCASCRANAEPSGTKPPPPAFVYALGRIEARFPNLGVEKEYAQVAARTDTTGKTAAAALHAVLSDSGNRYLARAMAWVLTIESVPTYILRPRDPIDLALLIDALRTAPRPTDVDVVIGIRGPLAPPELCNGLIVPVVGVDQVYSFDVDQLIGSIPKPESVSRDAFRPAAEDVFFRLQQIADNAGTLDEHRVLNYLAVRHPGIYALAAEALARDTVLSLVETRISRLSSTRRIYDVVFSFTSRRTDVTEKQFVRVDATDEFPFLVSKLTHYYDR
jgi:PatG Domain/Subtilase family